MEEELIEKLEHLKVQHKDLDSEIMGLMRGHMPDMITIQRLKKKKLEIKDMISRIQSMLQPDMTA